VEVEWVGGRRPRRDRDSGRGPGGGLDAMLRGWKWSEADERAAMDGTKKTQEQLAAEDEELEKLR